MTARLSEQTLLDRLQQLSSLDTTLSTLPVTDYDITSTPQLPTSLSRVAGCA